MFLCICMHLSIASLNSGSNGNCYYIGNESEAVIIDAGLSCKETEYRMNLLGLCMNKVKAIFISHEHTDHIKGLKGLAKKYSIPVFVTTETSNHVSSNIKKQLVKNFVAFQNILIGELTVIAFPKKHDAVDPHSFIIEYQGIRIGVFTDIGTPCERLTDHFQLCHAAFLESNYDEELLENGRYPLFLKNRIRGGSGHLSNNQALDVFIRYKPAFMTHLILSHLSRENNSPALVQKLFESHAGGTKIVVASRNEATSVYMINPTPLVSWRGSKTARITQPLQLSLF